MTYRSSEHALHGRAVRQVVQEPELRDGCRAGVRAGLRQLDKLCLSRLVVQRGHLRQADNGPTWVEPPDTRSRSACRPACTPCAGRTAVSCQSPIFYLYQAQQHRLLRCCRSGADPHLHTSPSSHPPALSVEVIEHCTLTIAGMRTMLPSSVTTLTHVDSIKPTYRPKPYANQYSM